jgi:hypothetical protein
MITPVKTFGFCFSYTGGAQKQLKGSLSFFKLGNEAEAFELKTYIIVLLYGNMTRNQQQKAKQRAEFRSNKVITAAKWLMDHNVKWTSCKTQYAKVIEAIKNPLYIDNSKVVEIDNDEVNPIEKNGILSSILSRWFNITVNRRTREY